MPQTLRRSTGTGPVVIGRSLIYALWEYCFEESEDGRPCNRRWTVRVSIDEAESLGLFPYQWVTVQLPGRQTVRAFFQGRRETPPFAMLAFER